PMDGLKLSAWADWADAKLREPYNGIPDGAFLPGSARFSAHGSVEEEFLLPAQTMGFVGGEINYVGARGSDFVFLGSGRDLPAYSRVDLHAGVRHLDWTLSLYSNNVFNRRGVLNGAPVGSFGATFFLPPRTMGIGIMRSF